MECTTDLKLFVLVNLLKWLKQKSISKEKVGFTNGNYYPKRFYCSQKPACFLCNLDCNLRNKYYKQIYKNGQLLFEIITEIPYEDEEVDEMPAMILEEIHKNNFMTKEEVLEALREKYFLEISERTLKYYGTERLIEPGSKVSLRGFVGSVSIYPSQTPLVIVAIKELKGKYGLKLNEISFYKNLIYKFDGPEIIKYLDEPQDKQKITRLEKNRFTMVLNYYGCAEAGYQYDYAHGGFMLDGKRILVVDYHEIKDGLLEEVHVELKAAAHGKIKSLSDLKTLKEVIYSKEGIEIKN